MRLSQLKKLFDRLPEEMTRVLGRKEFPVCWYGCAAEDLQLIDELNRADSPIGFIPSVYIYTDIRYTDAEWGGYHNLTTNSWHLDWLEKNDATILSTRFIAFKNNVREVRAISFSHRSSSKKQFIFMIDCANQFFENAALSSKLQIEIVGERGGMEGGNGPFCLGDLGAGWSFGQVPRSVFDIHDPRFNAPFTDPAAWGVPDIHDNITKSIRVPFHSYPVNTDEFCIGYGCRKVHRIDPQCNEALAEALFRRANHDLQHHPAGANASNEIAAAEIAVLKSIWNGLVGTELAAVTIPLALTGARKRRLLVWADSSQQPPWGTWSCLSSGPERREFSKMRAAVNAAIHPMHVDHIDFVHNHDHLQIGKRYRLNSRRLPDV
jgi:hypothetical protein